jgi:hypothetical protein
VLGVSLHDNLSIDLRSLSAHLFFVLVSEFDLLFSSFELSSFNHLLAVVPGTSSVGSGERNLDSRNNDTGEKTSGSLVTE